MRDRETESLRREGETRDCRWRFERALLALAGDDARDLARGPGDRAVGAKRHLVDPALLVVGRELARRALRVGRHQLAVVTTGDDAFAVGRGREDAAAVHGDLALAVGEQQRLLAEHEHRRTLEEMNRDDLRVRRGGADAVGERWDGGRGHAHADAAARASYPPLEGAVKEVGDSTLRHAGGEAFADFLFRQFAADEDDAAQALLALLPRPLMIAVEDHVHALEDEALGIVLEREDALAAQNVRAFLLHQLLHPREELVGIQGLLTPERHALHVFVVIVLESMTFAMVMMIVAMMMNVIVMMIVVVVMVV